MDKTIQQLVNEIGTSVEELGKLMQSETEMTLDILADFDEALIKAQGMYAKLYAHTKNLVGI